MRQFIAVLMICGFGLLSLHAQAEDQQTLKSTAPEKQEDRGGWLRNKIKQRLLKKIEEKPAPEARTDAQAAISNPGTYTYSVLHQQKVRYYKVHVPKSFQAENTYALVVALHGGGGDMEVQSTDEYYKFISTSEREGFVVLFPNGFSKFASGKLATWNAGKCCAAARDTKSDDVAFIRTAVGNIQGQMKIDPKRIFATGMSNGAMMSYRLACEASDLFRAIAPVAGTDNTEVCQPRSSISVLHIHSLLDDHVKFTGGIGKNAVAADLVTDFKSVPATIEKWAKLNKCQTKAERVLTKERAYCDRYSGCRDGVEVKLCVTEDGGHSWPGGKKPGRGASPSQALNATDIVWDFFKSQ